MPLTSSHYDSQQYDPAAPVVEIGVAKPGSAEAAVMLVALIDSGADATMLPINALQAAGGRYVERRQMRGVTGRPVIVETYLIKLRIGPFEFPGVEAVAMAPNSEALIGRDVLNQMVVTLNGLAHVVELSQ
jgi:predicted aspartyl protease